MRITKVRIRLCDVKGGPLAFASVVLDDAYIVYGMRIIRRADGAPQLLYPEAAHVRTRDQKQAYAFRPLSAAAHRCIEQAVLQAYNKMIGGIANHV